MFSLPFLSGCFFGFVWAQGPDYIFDAKNLPTIKDIYRVDLMISQLPLVVARDAAVLLGTARSQHLAATEQGIYDIDTRTISDFLAQSDSFEQFYQKVRITTVQFLMERGYAKFSTIPYKNGNLAISAQSWDFRVMKTIEEKDTLDMLLKDKLDLFADDFQALKKFADYLYFKNIQITPEEYEQLWIIFMFKNEQDLRDLWYELISWKSRKNVDREYRRHNIMAAFHNIGNVRLILPGETFNLAHEIHYRPNQGDIKYVSGYATFGASARMVYGWWLCGVATAFYQGTLTNLGLQLLQYSPHSTYYLDLFNAEINGIRISTPGLDATIYSPKYNLQMKNIRDYPIIAVFNFGWGESDEEEMFTLSKPQDRWSFEFVWRRGKCFTWNINGKNQTNCYDYIKNL